MEKYVLHLSAALHFAPNPNDMKDVASRRDDASNWFRIEFMTESPTARERGAISP